MVVPALIGAERLRVRSRRTCALRRDLSLLALGAGTFVCVLPQLAYWHAITGKWLVYTYGAVTALPRAGAAIVAATAQAMQQLPA